ncbi:ring finger protein 14 isoform 2 [Coprinopsis cinerea okayama7|uniref:RBR-type E3 ubiquitin transferase n=1 Tax=Coprinopsis cinerea (strain Okayama-7 / 130 / ATCC MYA-4618 / FGSC 9003) TaxID=240176 RepID=D6RJW6_COPC7|nr:ring finger protein 14 isoform 2 [Coprinopsis cinerea okayama7\|eukprot:XP_002912078.1 ring finger protein 14 isoform 2 [Coprinopsis cinerea okayama7\
MPTDSVLQGTLEHPEDSDVVKECRALQREEFEVLESIYPDCVSSNEITEGTLKLEVPIEFEGERKVFITQDAVLVSPTNDLSSNASLTSSSNPLTETVAVSTLPSLLVTINLPARYPLSEPPKLASIRATHLWLPRIGLLNQLLTEMWQEGDGVLYNWVEYLRTGEFLEALNLVRPSDGVIEIVHSNPPILAPLLTSHDASSKSSQFAQSSYPCSDFWGMCVEEGDVGRVGCPDPECVKQKREAEEEEVARVLTDAEVARWRWLREKRNLEKDPTIIHCPVDICQTPVPKPPGEDPESGWDRFRQCPRCSFSFCSFCRRTWHGPVTQCVMTHSEKIVLEYLAEDEGSEERETLEKRYGKKNIQNLVARYQEELANKEWLAESTTECPGCGCHMTCWKCGKHFCYRCGTGLNPSSPYAHFSQPGRCFQKLFDFQAEEEEWIPMFED